MQRIAPGWDSHIRFDGGHNLGSGLYALKIGFQSELYLGRPPAGISNITRISDFANREKICPDRHQFGPSAYRLSSFPKAKDGAVPTPLFVSADGDVLLQALSCTSKKLIEAATWHGAVNADGDEVWYVHEGTGFCETLFGTLSFQPGEFIYIPRLVPYFFHGELETDFFLLGVESGKELRMPHFPQNGVPYDPCDLLLPEPSGERFIAPQRKTVGKGVLTLKRENAYFRIDYAEMPFYSCFGWRGARYPFVLRASNIHPPFIGGIHTDPNLFALFLSEDNCVSVSAFLPRLVHSLPYFHMNEWDECLFFAKPYGAHGGVVGAGDMTYHPQGFFHGPHAEALRDWHANVPKEPSNMHWHDDFAVMIESRSPLTPTGNARPALVAGYHKSWLADNTAPSSPPANE